MNENLMNHMQSNVKNFIEDQITNLPWVYREFGVEGVQKFDEFIGKLKNLLAPEAPLNITSQEFDVMKRIRKSDPRIPYMSAEVRKLSLDGKKIDAIKLYRAQAEQVVGYMMSLKDAKDVIESIAPSNPWAP